MTRRRFAEQGMNVLRARRRGNRSGISVLPYFPKVSLVTNPVGNCRDKAQDRAATDLRWARLCDLINWLASVRNVGRWRRPISAPACRRDFHGW